MEEKLSLGPITIEREPRFNGLFIRVSIEDFISYGFDLGDSLDISFSNGYEMKDVPFYTGYYVGFDEPLVVAYQGYPYIDLTFNFTGSTIERINLSLDDTVTITMNQKGKYKQRQETLSQTHSNNREDFKTDESFCNFREFTKLNDKSSLIYRSASPCDDGYKRVYCTSELCRKYGVKYILDLADDQDDIDGYYNDKQLQNDYWRYLYEQNGVIACRLNVNYHSEKCSKKFGEILRFIINHQGPFLIQCSEGKDRTGFVGLIIAAIGKQSLADIEYDYMKTYDEYYNITMLTKPESYKAIKELYFNSMIEYICEGKKADTITDEDIYEYTKKYLYRCGLSDDEISSLEKRFTRN